MRDLSSPPPRATAVVVATEDAVGLRANQALAAALTFTHRCEYAVELRRDPKPPGPLDPDSNRRRLAGLLSGPTDLGDGVFVKIGDRVRHKQQLAGTVAGEDVWFMEAEEGRVDAVRRERTDLPSGIAERLVVTVAWPGPLTAGDVLASDGRAIGTLEAVFDDGSDEARLYAPVDQELGKRMEVTRTLPTAAQRTRARNIGPYGWLMERPLGGELVRMNQLIQLRDRGCLALFNDFAANKGASAKVRTRVYEQLAQLLPVEDFWVTRAELEATSDDQPPPSTPTPTPAVGPRAKLDIFSFFEKPQAAPFPTAPFEALHAHLAAAGLQLSLRGHVLTVALRPTGDVTEESAGEVTRAESIDEATGLPVVGGLFCERIFGPLRDYECACGRYKRLRHRGVVCDRCGVQVSSSSVRRERFGHLRLTCPILPLHLRPLVSALLGEDTPTTLDSLARDGGASVRARLNALDVPALLDSLPAKDPRRQWLLPVSEGRVELSELLWLELPILPPAWRPVVPQPDGGYWSAELNAPYSQVLRLVRNAPATEADRRELQTLCDALLTTLFRKSSSLLRPGAQRMDFSAGAVAVVTASAEAVVEVPWQLLAELAGPILYALAEQRGLATGIKASKALIEADPKVRRELTEAFAEDRLALVASTDESSPVLAATRVKVGAAVQDDPVIRIPQALAAQLGIATGDEVALHLPLSEPAIEEARWLLHAGAFGLYRQTPPQPESWLAALPRAPAATGARLTLGALSGEADQGLDPEIAVLLGGYPPMAVEPGDAQ